MRERSDRTGVPPRELRDFDVWCGARGIAPGGLKYPIRHPGPPGSPRQEAEKRIAANERAWTYPDWIAARQDWADRNGCWPVDFDPFDVAVRLDKPDRPIPRPAPLTYTVLPHPGSWAADDDGQISCLEHGLRADRHGDRQAH